MFWGSLSSSMSIRIRIAAHAVFGVHTGVDAQEHPALCRAHEAPARAPVKQPGRVGRAAPEKRSSTAARTGEIDKGDCANAYRGDTRERRLQDAAVDGAVGRRARAGGRSGRRAGLHRGRDLRRQRRHHRRRGDRGRGDAGHGDGAGEGRPAGRPRGRPGGSQDRDGVPAGAAVQSGRRRLRRAECGGRERLRLPRGGVREEDRVSGRHRRAVRRGVHHLHRAHDPRRRRRERGIQGDGEPERRH